MTSRTESQHHTTSGTTAAGPAKPGRTRPTGGAGERPVSSDGHGLHRGWIWALPAAALVFLLGSLWITGANAATDLVDSGAFVRWGLPVAKVVNNLAMVTTMGGLLFAIGIVPRFADSAHGRDRTNMAHKYSRQQREENLNRQEYPPFAAVLNLASAAAVTWTLAALAVLVLTYADISGRGITSSNEYTAELISYITTIDAGKEQATTVIVAAIVASLAFGVRSLMGLFMTLGISLIGIVDMALAGHSSGGNDHMGAVNSLGLHLLGISLWCGGLIALTYISRAISAPDAGHGTLVQGSRGQTVAQRQAPMGVAVLRRYSALALGGFILVTLSGVINTFTRLNHAGELFTTTYGQLALAKLAFTLILGGIGAAHRLRLIPAMSSGKVSGARAVWTAIAVELMLMGATAGLATSLARTAPPVPETLPSDAPPVRIITWYDMPPEPHVVEWFTQWRFDWFWVAFCVFVAYLYLWAFIKVRRAGGSWPVMRLVSWLVGLGLLTYVTSGALAVYGRVLFSAHMVEHMSLTMIVPVFLVLGAPITLFLKALEPRQDGTRGPREWILRIVHSGWSKVITHPIFAAVNFAGSIVVVYFTPMLNFILKYHVGHEFMIVHFLMTGYIFSLVLIGIDPIPYRPMYPIRLILLLATLGYHAFVGIAMMNMTSLLAASWFGNIGRPWGLSAIEDQQLGGSLMWGIGELPTMILAVAVGVQWAMNDKKVQKREDRQADRDGDAELNAYNEMFEQLAEKDRRR
ncbi:cytochrome c oxidase assembly protein [Rothia sp. LK2588]|uniref:cytochrome c oxidase assembly protein n=1 Tax=Rothia sp. LK2588 TaxID=3114369 RepID=UPI0034CD0B20